MFKSVIVTASVILSLSGVQAAEKTNQTTIKSVFAEMDMNKDGVIQQHEMLSEAKKYFSYLDTDQDMKLQNKELPEKNMATLARLIALDHAMMVKGKIVGQHLSKTSFFKEVDTNKDNSIEAAEFMKPMIDVFKAADSDSDKKLTFDEFTKRVEAVSKISFYKNVPTRHHLLAVRDSEAVGGILSDEIKQARQ